MWLRDADSTARGSSPALKYPASFQTQPFLLPFATTGHSLPRTSRGPAALPPTSSSPPTLPPPRPVHLAGRFSRFWDRRHGDTSYLTVPQSDSASYGSTADTWVRKGEQGPGHGRQYLQYQDGDREARARHRDQVRKRDVCVVAER